MKILRIKILASQRNGTLYIGVTSNLINRVWQHKSRLIEGFTKTYIVDKLVYYEEYNEITYTLKREKRLKQYNRQWKVELIEKSNPEWKDLYDDFITGFPGQAGE